MGHTPVRHTHRGYSSCHPPNHLHSRYRRKDLVRSAVDATMTPDSATTLRSCSSIQLHLSSISSCTMPPIHVVIDAVETKPHLLATSTLSPLLELRGVHHPQHVSAEQQNLPRRRLDGGYDMKVAVAAQSRLNFGLLSGRGSEVDRRDLDIASTEDNSVEICRRCRTEQANQSFLRSPSYTTKPPSAPDPATDHEPKPAEMREPWGSTQHEGESRRIHRISPSVESSDPAWSAATTTTPQWLTAFKPET